MARWLLVSCLLYACRAPVTYTNLGGIPPSSSLADGFKVSLVRPPDEAANSGQKIIVQSSSIHLLSEEEQRVLDDYDALFEKYSLFCNGRWLGVQVLQDSQDLLYLQHIVYMKKPDVIVETGTYKGGLTYFFATLLDWIEREAADMGTGDANASHGKATVLSIDKHHPDQVFAANWFCPVCADCIKSYETRVWERKVRFVQGMADADDTYSEILAHFFDLGIMRLVPKDSAAPGVGDVVTSSGPAGLALEPSRVVLVNLDANHEFEGLMRELFFYAPLVSENSYLIVQDAKLDKIWGTPGPTAAVQTFLNIAPEGEFVIEDELKFHAYSQHMYLRRARVTVDHSYFLKRATAIVAANAANPRADGEL